MPHSKTIHILRSLLSVFIVSLLCQFSLNAQPEAVDLGLSVRWASCNLGASKPYEYGYYYVWGDIEPKTSSYVSRQYKWSVFDGIDDWFGFSIYRPIKYCNADHLTLLNSSDDAASVALGNGCRMPTHKELQELYDGCNWVWTSQNGIKGYNVVSKKNGKSIFLPCAGRLDDNPGILTKGKIGSYLTKEVSSGYRGVYALLFNQEVRKVSSFERYYAMSIRPVIVVSEKKKDVKPEKPEPAKTKASTVTASPVKTTENDLFESNGMQVIDLGLSVKWASCNLGASRPEEYGGYYAWGEVEPKDDYSWETYKWCKYDGATLTKYCIKPDYAFNGNIDFKRVLDPEDDAARVKLGGKWRLPTEKEVQELLELCSQEVVEINGVRGFKITSNMNGKSIFLPAAGCRTARGLSGDESLGYYYTSYVNKSVPYLAVCLLLGRRTGLSGDPPRSSGCSIRPVYVE